MKIGDTPLALIISVYFASKLPYNVISPFKFVVDCFKLMLKPMYSFGKY